MIQIFIKIVLVGIVSSCLISLLLVEDTAHLKYWEQISYGVISLIVVLYIIDLCKEPLQLTRDGIVKWIISKNITKSVYINRIHELEKELSDSKKEIDNLRSMSMENSSARETTADISACREQVVEALGDAADNEQDIPYTLWRAVLAMRKEGLTDKQIAAKLNDKGQGVSQSQLGCLLYTGNERLPASKTLQNYGTRLFSKLPG